MLNTNTEWRNANQSRGAGFEPLTLLDRWWAEIEPTHAYRAATCEAFAIWQRELRAAVEEKLGRMPEPLPLAPRIIEEGTWESGVRYRYGEVDTAKDFTVPFMLLIPEGVTANAPGVVCLHGHGGGMNPLFGLDIDGNAVSDEYQHAFALEACRRGFVSLCYDQLGFGRRRDFEYINRFKVSACDLPTKLSFQLGSSMMGLRVFDARQMISLLGMQPEVNADRLAISGISGGGAIAFFTAVLDERLRAAMISGYFNRFSVFMHLHHCIDNFVPGLANVAEAPDMGCAIAPRPLLISQGERDPIFPLDATKQGVEQLRLAYSLFDAEAGLEEEYYDDSHVYSNARVWDFFRKWV